ncbi:unnamed protein product [marine sediment metagenome]|uniref:Uncharacterized protein n=1 Tax=marine sediment metagenome TaxID=412755 RepID=X1NHD5_9ZZZZ
MAIPQDRLSTVPVPDDYLPPNGDTNYLLEWHEGGPIAINDTSAGLNYQGWVMTYSDPDFTLTPDTTGLPETVGLPVAGVTQLSFCFDQNGRASIAYTQGGVAYLYWFDTVAADFVTTASAEGAISPALTLDDKRVTQTQSSDMLLFYTMQEFAADPDCGEPYLYLKRGYKEELDSVKGYINCC